MNKARARARLALGLGPSSHESKIDSKARGKLRDLFAAELVPSFVFFFLIEPLDKSQRNAGRLARH